MKSNMNSFPDFALKALFVVLLLLVSCNKGHNNLSFSDDNIKNVIHLTNGKVYSNEKLFLGYPMRLEFHPDSFLIVQDFNTEKLIKIIDLKNNKIQELIPKGRGPGEILVSWGLKVIGKEVFVFDGQIRKIIKLTPDSNRKFEISGEFEIEEKQAIEFYPINNENFVCLSVTSVERLTFLDGTGKIIRKTGSFPQFNSNQDIEPNNDIFQSTITGSPDGEKIAVACKRTDIIDIYDLAKNTTKRIQGPIGVTLNVIDHGIAKSTDPRFITYTILTANNDEFWASYNGYKYSKGVSPSTEDQFPKQIYCFDWDGKLLRKYVLDFTFGGYAVDWKNKILYTIENRDNIPIIVEYQLDKIHKY